MYTETKTYNLDNLPTDAEVWTSKTKEFKPLPENTYQVQLVKAELRDNIYYKPDEADASKRGSKYQLSLEFAVVEDTEWYGRRLWVTPSLALKPMAKSGPTILYKVVTKLLKSALSWEDCASYAPSLQGLMENLSNLVKSGAQLRVATQNVTKENGKIKTAVSAYYEASSELPVFDAEKSKAMAKGAKENVSASDLPF